MRTLLLLFVASLLLALPAWAQRSGTIRPGMTADDVRSIFGPPASVRQAGEWSYLYYLNNCPVRCGSDDVVFLQADTVVAAVLRAPYRRFAGPGASAALREAVDLPPREGLQPVGQQRTPPQTQQVPRSGIRVQVPATGLGPARRPPPTNLGVIRGRAGAITADTVAPDTVAADTALDQQRQLREQRVEPRTIRRDTIGAPADTSLDRQRQEREQRVEPRTVRPRPPAPPR